MYLICHVELQDQVIKGSCDSKNRYKNCFIYIALAKKVFEKSNYENLKLIKNTFPNE